MSETPISDALHRIDAAERRYSGTPYRTRTNAMTWSSELQHLSAEDLAEVNRLLAVVFRGDAAASEKWIKDHSEQWRCAPLALLKRDEVGVEMVLSFLKHCALNSAL